MTEGTFFIEKIDPPIESELGTFERSIYIAMMMIT